MDLHKAIGQFFTPSGGIQLPPQLTLAGVSEMFYQADLHAGGGDRHCMRFWDYSNNQDGEPIDYTREQINTRIKSVAARLQQIGQPGGRVAILAGNSPEYIFGFVGALYAAMVPVPLYDPREPGHGEHLKAVLQDSQASIILTNKASAQAVREHFGDQPARQRPRIIAIDALPDALAASWVNPEDIPTGKQSHDSTAPIKKTAFLQYTSGSTRTPAGVVLTNESILSNVLQIFAAAQLKSPLRVVSWLPLHHDMGIIVAVFVVLFSLPMDMMSPRDFIQQPKRWTDQLSKRGSEDGNVYAVVPNFALELAVRYGKPDEGQDFSGVAGIIIGSEPVSRSAVENFTEVFSAYGLKRSALRPSYGLAEASLLVTTPQDENRPVISYFDREKLSTGKLVEVDKSDEKAVSFISNGQVVRPQVLTIVDPETKAELPDGVVGEIWAHGENLAAGYLGRPEDTADTFDQVVAKRLETGSRMEGTPEGGWLATGDLGAVLHGQTYITGRLKDLIVIAGRNHYPQDIEATAQAASENVRQDSVAAFAIPGDEVEKLVILAERADDAQTHQDQSTIQAIRAAVAENHGINASDIRMLAPMEILRSSSGKIARRVNQRNYLSQTQ